MKFLQQRQNQLTAILYAWNQLDPATQQASINLIIPLIESASLLSSQIFPNENLVNELKVFQEKYQANYGKNISELGVSDLTPDSMKFLEAVYQIDQSDKPIESKRAEVLELAKSLPALRQKLEEEIDHKYQNAHARVSYNYGKFISEIFKTRDQEAKEILFNKVRDAENEEDFFKALLELNKVADIPSNFDLLKKQFGIDGLEEHTSINQGTLYRANLDNSDLLNQIEGFSDEQDLVKKSQDFFTKTSALKSIKVDTKGAKQAIAKEAEAGVKGEIKAEITTGFEMEFLLLPIGGPAAEKKRLLGLNLFEKFNEGFADLDSRKLMREKYGFPHDKIAHTANALLLFSEQEISQIARVNGESNKDKREAIKTFLSDQKDIIDPKLLDASIKNIDLLSIEEIFFLDLLLLKYDKAVDLKLNLDGAFESSKSLKENLENILPFIANQGSFYAKTLDMIRAHEIAFGPFSLSESLVKKDEAISHLRNVAQTHGLRAKDRDVQINIGAALGGKSVLAIEVEEQVDGKKVTISEAAIAVIKALQIGLRNAIEENPWIDRKGQETIVFMVDRKKGLKLQGTEYIITFDSVKMLDDSSAFPVHRSNTGKSGMMRLALIDRETGVIELRLLSNNTHVPHHDGAVREVENGIDIVPEIILASVAKELAKLPDLSKLIGRVEINPDGSVATIPPVLIDHSNGSEAPSVKYTPSAAVAATSNKLMKFSEKEAFI